MEFSSVRDLVDLPYFCLKNGQVHLDDGLIDGIIDMHTHIGWHFGMARPVDQDAGSVVRHYFPDHDAPVDLSRYSAYDFTPRLKRICAIETVKPVLTSHGYVKTHTAVNLLSEMRMMGIKKAAVLAIDIGNSDNSETVLSQSRKHPEFVPFVSVDPKMPGKRKRLRELVEKGAKGVKIHPPMQLVRPSGKSVYGLMECIRECSLPVLFHCGYSPLMPPWENRYSRMDDFKAVCRDFPEVRIILGHAGIDAWVDVMEIARRYPNVYVELSGQPPQVIRSLVNGMGSDRLFFGSDWPYYPIALPLAKVLLATEGDRVLRRKLLRENARRFLED